MPQFEWDEAKNAKNVAKHGIDFRDAQRIFSGPCVTRTDERSDMYGELREITVGLLDGVSVIVVVHTDRDGRIRIISARRALRHERKRYEAAL